MRLVNSVLAGTSIFLIISGAFFWYREIDQLVKAWVARRQAKGQGDEQ